MRNKFFLFFVVFFLLLFSYQTFAGCTDNGGDTGKDTITGTLTLYYPDGNPSGSYAGNLAQGSNSVRRSYDAIPRGSVCRQEGRYTWGFSTDEGDSCTRINAHHVDYEQAASVLSGGTPYCEVESCGRKNGKTVFLSVDDINKGSFPGSGNRCFGDDKPSDDPDIAQRACESDIGIGSNWGKTGSEWKRDWWPGAGSYSNKCCGDDSGDCLSVGGDYICVDYTDSSGSHKWRWSSISAEPGNILDVECGNYALLLTSEGAVACTDLPIEGGKNFPKQVYDVGDEYHEYLCDWKQEGGKWIIHECCADDGCDSDPGAYGSIYQEQHTKGQAVELDDIPYYCAGDSDYQYPLDQGDWTPNLDSVKYSSTCPVVPTVDPDNPSSSTWTGSYCCGETAGEYYSEKEYPEDGSDSPKGACFESVFRADKVSFSSNGDDVDDILVHDGKMYGCRIDETRFVMGNEWVLEVNDAYSGGKAVTNEDFCAAYGEGSSGYYCDWDGRWKTGTEKSTFDETDVEAGNRTAQRWDPYKTSTGCCPSDYCWDGKKCFPAQNRKPLYDPSDISGGYSQWLEGVPLLPPPNQGEYYPSAGFRCIIERNDDGKPEADWRWQEIKQTPDWGMEGFCESGSQCLWDRDSKEYIDHNNFYPDDTASGFIIRDSFEESQNPQCIESGEYIGDNYCETGEWATRTKHIASTLLNFAEKEDIDYSLFCGNYLEALNFCDYEKDPQDPYSYYNVCDSIFTISPGSPPAANNVCVLKYRKSDGTENIVLGTTLNKDIAVKGPTNILYTGFGQSRTSCSGELGDDIFTGYGRCTFDISDVPIPEGYTAPTILYNPDLDSLIYFASDAPAPSDTPYPHWLLDSLNDLVDLFFGSTPFLLGDDPGDNPEFLRHTSRFSKIFFDRKITNVDARVQAILEEKSDGRYHIYIDLRGYQDMDICQTLEKIPTPHQFSCKSITLGSYDVSFKAGSMQTLREYWADLTEKLRAMPAAVENPSMVRCENDGEYCGVGCDGHGDSPSYDQDCLTPALDILAKLDDGITDYAGQDIFVNALLYLSWSADYGTDDTNRQPHYGVKFPVKWNVTKGDEYCSVDRSGILNIMGMGTPETENCGYDSGNSGPYHCSCTIKVENNYGDWAEFTVDTIKSCDAVGGEYCDTSINLCSGSMIYSDITSNDEDYCCEGSCEIPMLECSTVQGKNCPSNTTKVLMLGVDGTELTDAHAYRPDANDAESGGATHSICCSASTGANVTVTEKRGQSPFIFLIGNDDHAATPNAEDPGNYLHKLYLNTVCDGEGCAGAEVKCREKMDCITLEEGGREECIVAVGESEIDGSSNAHIESCDVASYSSFMCCSLDINENPSEAGISTTISNTIP